MPFLCIFLKNTIVRAVELLIKIIFRRLTLNYKLINPLYIYRAYKMVFFENYFHLNQQMTTTSGFRDDFFFTQTTTLVGSDQIHFISQLSLFFKFVGFIYVLISAFYNVIQGVLLISYWNKYPKTRAMIYFRLNLYLTVHLIDNRLCYSQTKPKSTRF